MPTAANNGIILEVTHLTKSYNGLTAVKNLSFKVKKGEVFGFLGPNGAGKSTTINMISGLLKPDCGTISINGVPAGQSGGKARSLIGLCPQNITLWEGLTCIEQLEFMGHMYDIGRIEARGRGLELLDALGLSDKRDKLGKTLSGGMQRRLNIALALVHKPEIVILDEPQAGLDPQSRVLVREYIRSLAKKSTVILTTHEMDEAERLSDTVAIIDRGELLVADSPTNLINNAGRGDILEFGIMKQEAFVVNNAVKDLAGKMKNISFKDDKLRIESVDLFDVLPEIIRVLKESKIHIGDMRIRKRTLEDIFISLTGRGLRE